MAPEDHSGAKPAGPVVLRIKLRYDDLDAMVQKFAPNVGKSGLFLPTKSIQPVGTEVKFELRLTNDVPVLVGLGRVRQVRPPDPANPKAAYGMAIELLRVSREGREVIIRMIDRRRQLGLADVAIPMLDEAEGGRRAGVDSAPRAETSAMMRDAMAQLASAPLPDQGVAARPASGPNERSGGIAALERRNGSATHEATTDATTTAPRRPSAPLLTSPRSSSGAITVAPLAPEKSRARRPRVQELIDKASELSAPNVVAEPDLDVQIDVDRVLTRARTLAGGDLDVELAMLREAAAAPVEISIETASAELARQLGGKPIARRERSGAARWAPPPAVAELRARSPVGEASSAIGALADEASKAGQGAEDRIPFAERTRDEAAESRQGANDSFPFSAKTRAETEGAPSATIAAAVEAVIEADVARPSEPRATSEPRDEHAAAEPLAADVAMRGPIVASDDDPTPVLPRDGYDDAFVPSVSTTTAVDDPLEPRTEKPRRFASANDLKTEPSSNVLLINDDADVLSFERALDAARVHTGVGDAPLAPPDDPATDNDGAAELLASGEYQLADLDDADEVGEAEPPPQEHAEAGGGVDSYAAYPDIPDQLAAQLDQQLAEAEAQAGRHASDGFAAEPRYLTDGTNGDEDEAEEISDLDVLAEADEDDADLLSGHTNHDTIAPPVAPSDGSDTIAPPVAASYGHDAVAPASAALHDRDTIAPGSDQSNGDEPPDDFASRLDLGDDDDVGDDRRLDSDGSLGDDDAEQPPSDDFDRDAAREFDREAAREFDREAARDLDRDAARDLDDAGPGRYDRAASPHGEPRRPVLPALAAEPAPVRRYRRPSSEFPDPPSSSYTFAENYPEAGLQLGPDDAAGEDFDEPHAYAPAAAPERARRPSGPDPRLLRYGRATTASTEDLEDALAALDVDLDDLSNLDQRRPRRPTPNSSTGSRPLPGLPIERVVDRAIQRPRDATGSTPKLVAPRSLPASGGQTAARAQPPAQAASARAAAATGAHLVGKPAGAPGRSTKPPPIPTVARRPITQQPDLAARSQRASTDDGVIIDFDDDSDA